MPAIDLKLSAGTIVDIHSSKVHRLAADKMYEVHKPENFDYIQVPQSKADG
jgi:hypothetical protein